MNDAARSTGSEKHCHTGITRSVEEITSADLPLRCPLPDECVVDAHPRVYLALDNNGHARCHYCSREFVLKSSRQ